MKFFALTLLLLVAQVSHAHTGLIPVASTYKDEGTLKSRELQGSGLTFSIDLKKAKTRLFVLTASHVSQGKLGLEIDQHTLNPDSILGRLSSDDEDVELIELKPDTLTPLGFWNSDQSQIQIDIPAFKTWAESQNPDAILRMTPPGPTASEVFTLKGDWVKKSGTAFSQSFEKNSQYGFGTTKDDWEKLSYLPLTDEIYSNSTLTPGMSGAPLLKMELGCDQTHLICLSVHGLARRTLRGLPGSWFASDHAISVVIHQYLKGQRGHLKSDLTTWHMRNSLTYRDFGNGSAEIFPASAAIADGVRGDGADGVRGDGGDSVEDFMIWNPDLWKELDISPGIRFGGNPILGFTLLGNTNFYLEDNPKSLFDLAKHGRPYFKPQPISLRSNFKKLLSEKLKGLLNQEKTDDELALRDLNKGQVPIHLLEASILSGLVKHESEQDFIKAAIKESSQRILSAYPEQFALLNGKDDLNLLSSTQNTVLRTNKDWIEIRADRIHFELEGPAPEYESISFDLDPQGRLLGLDGKPENPFFIPILQRLTQTRKHVLIDLRSVFFVDASRFKAWIWDGSLGAPPADVSQISAMDFALAASEGPILRFRTEDSPQIYEIQFNSIRALKN